MHQHVWGVICLSGLLLGAACDLVTSPGDDDAADDEIEAGAGPVLTRRTVEVPVVSKPRTDATAGAAFGEEQEFDDPDRCLPP